MEMRQALEQRIAALSREIETLDAERQALAKRDSEIEVRLHQVVGAIYEMQQLIADLDRLPSGPLPVSELSLPEKPE